MANTIQQAGELGQSVWYDNMRRGMLESGELQGLIDAGITGLTSNPTIFEKAITGSTDYDDALLEQAREGGDAGQIYEHLVVDDIRAAADLLRPVYDRTDGADGFASLEVSPHLAHDTDGTVAEAKRLFETLDRPQRDDEGARHAAGHSRRPQAHRRGASTSTSRCSSPSASTATSGRRT